MPGTKLFEVLWQIMKQVPSAFRASCCRFGAIGDRRQQQLTIDVRDPIVDCLPALLHLQEEIDNDVARSSEVSPINAWCKSNCSERLKRNRGRV